MLCPPEYTAERREIAVHLANIYDKLEIWELSEDMPWIKYLDRRKVDDLKSGINMFKRTRYSRMQNLIRKLDKIEVTPLSQALHAQQDDLQQRAAAYL